jgi:glycerol-3-phosphate cytidylyltransferase-like family protein
MGNFGQSLVRGLHLCGVNEDEYAVADDGADGFSRSHRVLRIEAASPVDHFVVTTPEQVDAMRKRLECRGFRHGGDWLTVQEVVDQVARGRTQQVAPVTSRVAECRQASR